MDNFKTVYQILKILEAALDYVEMDEAAFSAERLGVTENRRNAIMLMLMESGYIVGVKVAKSIGGIWYDFRDIRITLKGLEYLNENSTMKKAANLIKGIKDTLPGL